MPRIRRLVPNLEYTMADNDTVEKLQPLVDISEQNAMEVGKTLCDLLHKIYTPLDKVIANDDPKFSDALNSLIRMPAWRYSYTAYMKKYHTAQILALVYRDPIEGVSENIQSLCLDVIRYYYNSLAVMIGWQSRRILQYTPQAMTDYMAERKVTLIRTILVFQALQRIRGDDATITDAAAIVKDYEGFFVDVGIDPNSIYRTVDYILVRKQHSEELARKVDMSQKRKLCQAPVPPAKERKL